MIVVVTRIKLKYRVDPLTLIEGLDLLCVLPDTPQDRIPGRALLVPQGEVHAVRSALRRMGEEVLLHAGKPEGAGHAAHPGEQICPVDGIQGKEPRQGVSGDPTPTRDSVNLLLCRWNNLLGEEAQIFVRTTGAGLSIFESRWTVPGDHIVVPLQITDGHQCERWATGSLCSLEYLLPFTGEGVEVNNWGSRFGVRKNRYSFAANCKRLHIGSSTFCIGNHCLLKFKLFSSLYSKETADTTGAKGHIVLLQIN